MSKIVKQVFENGKAFIAFLTAGDPLCRQNGRLYSYNGRSRGRSGGNRYSVFRPNSRRYCDSGGKYPCIAVQE